MMSHRTLISADQLQALLLQPDRPILLLDLGFDLNDPAAGERAYALGHLPGAHYLHLDRELSGQKTGKNGRHPLPERIELAQRMTALGLRTGSQVICYDAQGGMYAARAWWMLRWVGHADVAVLDGGLQAWQAAGGALSIDTPEAARGDFQVGEPLVRTLDADQLQVRLGSLRLIDARAPERFRGEVEPLDALAGHIPGASNRLFKHNLGPDGRFLSPTELREQFDSLLAPHAPAQVVHQCGSGVTACHNLLAMEHAGLSGSALYPGSWSEWSADPRRPVARS